MAASKAPSARYRYRAPPFRISAPSPTRWMDNDVYGHINNVQYYSFFDTVVNGYLIAQGALDPGASAVIGLVVETHCNYFAPLTFPQGVDAGLRVAHLGTSSVRYEIGLFAKASEPRRRRAISCTSMSIASPGGPRYCRRGCVKR